MTSSLSIETRRSNLNAVLGPDIKGLLESTFVRDLEAGRMEPGKIWQIFSQYRHYCAGFTEFLEILLSRTASPVAQKPLLENLWEEKGSGDSMKTHVRMLEDFVGAWGEALGKTPESSRALPSAEAPVAGFVRDIRTHLQSAPLPSAFGFIGPGTEEVTSRQYSRWLRGLKTYGLVESSKLEFFEVHIVADIQHADHFWQALEHVASSEADWLEVVSGAKRSLRLETQFWNEIVGVK